MSDTVNGHTIPEAKDFKDTNENAELDNINTVLTALCGVIDPSGNLANPTTDANVGTANTGVTAVEYGDGTNHRTVLTVSQADALTIADNAALADGYKVYTFPTGVVVVKSVYMSMAISAASTEAQADTPDVGIGTVIASGVVATLDGTGTFENLLTGQTAADANGTATVKTAVPTAGTSFVIESGDAHTVHFNAADTWADDTGGDLTADIAGTIVIDWTFLV